MPDLRPLSYAQAEALRRSDSEGRITVFGAGCKATINGLHKRGLCGKPAPRRLGWVAKLTDEGRAEVERMRRGEA